MSGQAADGDMCLGILSSLPSLPCPPGGEGVENGHLCPHIRDGAGCSAACVLPCCALRQERGACREELSHRYRVPVPSSPESFQNPEQGKLLKEQGLPVPSAAVLQARTTLPRAAQGARLLPAQCAPSSNEDTASIFHLRGDKEQQVNRVVQLL